jgi:hypothetical protein
MTQMNGAQRAMNADTRRRDKDLQLTAVFPKGDGTPLHNSFIICANLRNGARRAMNLRMNFRIWVNALAVALTDSGMASAPGTAPPPFHPPRNGDALLPPDVRLCCRLCPANVRLQRVMSTPPGGRECVTDSAPVAVDLDATLTERLFAP